MRKVEAAGRSVMRLAYLAAGVALVAVLVLAAVYEERSREAFRQSARAEVQDRLGLLRSDLQGTLNANAETARALAGVVRYQPDIDQAAFERLGAELIAGQPSIRTITAAPDLGDPPGLSPRGEPGGARPRLSRHARAGRGGGAGAGPGRDGAGGAGRARAGRDRVHRPHAGLRRRGRGRGAAVLGHRVGGHRRGGALPRERARRPAPGARRGDPRAGTDGSATARPFFGDAGDPRAGPGHRRGEPAGGRLADRRGAEGRLAAAAGALGGARALRPGGPARSWRRSSARRSSWRRARPRWR